MSTLKVLQSHLATLKEDLGQGGKIWHTDVVSNRYGWSIIVRDDTPIDILDEAGDEHTVHQGTVVLAVSATDLATACHAATARIDRIADEAGQ
ncbi:hypothetical protein CH302_19445 [Rhodococcus sp. 15-2388-1-1a]|uniref:hypothetical protein n=1 Tax=Nocardiaceae TaxID=85025 RepID=UPI000561825B|nr:MULTISPECIES: hypothetical protein [Rhodococcus]OZE95117.1 hypothetical protein CH302_19445 [Rhodococcus sp. 15-2388-1-1a]